MTTVYKYRVRCTTENAWKIVWGDTDPTVCPTNTIHTIDTSLTSIIDIVEKQRVSIQEETVPTGGNFQCTSLVINADGGQVGSAGISWPYPVTALQVDFITSEENAGDVINMYGGKDTIVGNITASVAVASAWADQNYVAGEVVVYNHPLFGSRVYTCLQDTVSNEIPIIPNFPGMPDNLPYWIHGFELNVSPTVTEFAYSGFEIALFNGVNRTDMGRIISVNRESNKVYVENNVDMSYSHTTPTYVQRTIYFLKNYCIDKPWHRVIGGSKIGGSNIPPNIFIHGEYTNNGATGSGTKTIIGHVEYLY